ncbi:hypothetical protein ACB094_06G051600 [Castanea mollissima]
MEIFAFVFLSSSLLFFYFVFADAVDSVTQFQSLSDGTTLVSKDGSFALGFFSTGNSTNRYLGIWYNNIQVTTIVWVANRHNPIKDLSGVLMVNNSVSLVLLSHKTVAWLANSTKEAQYPIVQLLGSGNLLGWDLGTGLDRHLSAWKSSDNPSPGNLTWGIELHNYLELDLKKGSEKYFRSELEDTTVYNFNVVSNKDEVYFSFDMIQKSVISRVVLSQRFNPKSPEHSWNPNTWFEGCDKFGFGKFFGFKLPDTTYSWMKLSMNINECRDKSLNNCSCMAYSNTNIRDGGSGYTIWFGDLIEIRQMASNKLQDANS